MHVQPHSSRYRPYEIFTGLADDDEGIMLPKNVSKGTIIKSYDEDGKKHYDFQFKNKRGYKMTIEGLDGKFDPEFWNYAKLISGVLRYGMPIDQVIKLVQGMELNNPLFAVVLELHYISFQFTRTGGNNHRRLHAITIIFLLFFLFCREQYT